MNMNDTSNAETAKMALTGMEAFTSVYMAPAQRPACCWVDE